MLHKRRTFVRPSSLLAALTAAIAVSGGQAQAPASDTPTGPPVIFSTALPDMPGRKLVVVALTIPPRGERPAPGHRHPGSVYVYVTEGTARFGIEGQPVQEVKMGESFFEPPGVLHTVMESADPTKPAAAIAVMIVPEGAPLTTPANPR
jgi:quercetin dioxygenase-like cupin family protein